MKERWTKLAARIGRAVGFKTKIARAERLSASRTERPPKQSYVEEENGRVGRRYFR